MQSVTKAMARCGISCLLMAAITVPHEGKVSAQCWSSNSGTACSHGPNGTQCGTTGNTWWCAWESIAGGDCSQAVDATSGAANKQVYDRSCMWRVFTCGGSHGECQIGGTYTYIAECSTSSGASCPPPGGGGGGEHMLPEYP